MYPHIRHTAREGRADARALESNIHRLASKHFHSRVAKCHIHMLMHEHTCIRSYTCTAREGRADPRALESNIHRLRDEKEQVAVKLAKLKERVENDPDYNKVR
jgi:hypothetical protein